MPSNKLALIDYKSAAIYTIASFFIINFLFFIDEGYNSFEWMKNSGNWIVFFLYLICFVLGQIAVSLFFQRHLKALKHIIAIPLGSVLGFLIVLLIIF